MYKHRSDISSILQYSILKKFYNYVMICHKFSCAYSSYANILPIICNFTVIIGKDKAQKFVCM